MSDHSPLIRSHQQWARLRFSVVGPLLACPPPRGQLQGRLQELAARNWRHPVTGGERVRVRGVSCCIATA